MKSIGVVINGPAGSAGEKQVAAVRSALEKSGVRYELEVLSDGSKLEETIKRLAKKHQRIAVGGGDGTINTGAKIVVAAGKELAVLPLGTLNHFAKDVGVPLDINGMVEVAVRGSKIKVDYGTVNEELFLNNSSIGLYPMLVRRRERQEGSIGRYPAAALELWRILRRPLRQTALDLRVDGEKLQVKTPFMFIGNNDYKVDRLGFNNRSSLTGGRLSLYIYQGHSRWNLAQAFMASWFGRDASRHLLIRHAKSIDIIFKPKTTGVALDGEVKNLPSPLHYRVRAKGLTVMRP
jgi:diacylglycerol kinase family enzyme